MTLYLILTACIFLVMMTPPSPGGRTKNARPRLRLIESVVFLSLFVWAIILLTIRFTQ